MKRGLLSVFCSVTLLWTAGSAETVIKVPTAPSYLESLAAKEIRRYVYLRTGQVLLVTNQTVAAEQIIVGRKDRPEVVSLGERSEALRQLGEEDYRLFRDDEEGQRRLWVVGGADVGVLYGAYRLIEQLGVRFYLHGDVVPDDQVPWALPEVDETGHPLFGVRGITPFHDFPEGPDWWERDDYLAHISQLAKMRMNFIGFHCYPERGRGPEPLVWIGLPGEFDDASGNVSLSYPAQWHSTSRNGMWGFGAMKSGQFAAGAGRYFPWDDFGHTAMRGMLPTPQTLAQGNRMFNQVGDMLGGAFRWARSLGVKTCIGTETPITVPRMVRERLLRQGRNLSDPEVLRDLYRGTFQRIMATHPLDYYWLWTPETWTWGGYDPRQFQWVKQDIASAVAVLDELGNPFQLATSGWVLGPVNNRTVLDSVLPPGAPMACINREVGHAGVERAFARVGGRPKWAMPWLENDWSMTAPQSWVGRVRYDAADALRLGCDGLIGLHWRTKVIAPTISALAAAGWDQNWVQPSFDTKQRSPDLVVGEASVMTGFRGEVQGVDDPYVYSTVRCNVEGYAVEVPNGVYTVTLKFCEGLVEQAGERVFSVKLQGELVEDKLDVIARVGLRRPLDLSFTNVLVNAGVLRIDFDAIAGKPCISAFTIDGETQPGRGLSGERWSKKINCSGLHYKDYSQDLFVERFPDWNRDRSMKVEAFFTDFAATQFGKSVGEELGRILAELDGVGMPEPTVWRQDGPGFVKPNPLSWAAVSRDYAFVDAFAAVRGRVRGEGYLARFDYWLSVFQTMRATAKVGCLRGQLDKRMEAVFAATEATARKAAATQARQARSDLLRGWEEMMTFHLQATDTTAALGTIANLEQHSRTTKRFLSYYDERLTLILGEELTDTVSTEYRGQARLSLPTVRTHASPGEVLALRVHALDRTPMKRVSVYWRKMGRGDYGEVALTHIARAVYRGGLPVESNDFEYYVEAETEDGNVLRWPPTAPRLNQTVVVLREPSGK